MANVKITTTIPNIDDVIAIFDKIKVYRSTTGEEGVYAEITDASTRLTLVADQTGYVYTDTAGAATYWYSTSFYSSTSDEESSRSDPVQGEHNAALSVISIDELKTNHLFGIDLTDEEGNPFPDSMYQYYIEAAVGWVERKLDIRIRPTVITDEKQDFYRQDYYKYIRMQTDEFPIINVDSIKLVLPTEQEIIDFDPSWFQIQKHSGQVEIIPGRGQLSVITLGQSGAWLPLIYGWTDYIPQVFRITYTAGFEKVPPELKELIGKVAALGPLHVAGDLIVGAGIASESVGIDGITTAVSTTQSATNSGYGARITNYWREIKMQLKDLRTYYKGIRMVIG